ncbi:MAG TPA: hypothetical protein EYG38_18095, partial [Verrucomicrobia bacterium]|nr:hypothetical protein [Verrucomicrobiota bacterium]
MKQKLTYNQWFRRGLTTMMVITLHLFTAGTLVGQTGLREGIVAEWNFSEASGLTASDSSGANVGVLIDFPDDSSHWVSGVHGGGIEF